jgi:tubulin-specific chaperone B
MSEYQIITQPFVNLTVISDDREFGSNKRYAKDLKLIDFKNKIEMMTGYQTADMKLKLLNKNKQVICDLDDNDKMIGFYPMEDGYFVEVDGGTNVLGSSNLPDDPNFTRYELTDAEYQQKQNTMRDFKQKNKLGQFNKERVALEEKLRKEKIEEDKLLLSAIPIGSRCQVRAPNAPTRVGTVMYTGELDGKPGLFVGVKYDEPLGKNDGSVEGKRYFECSKNYGGFVKPEHVTVGDFPEESFDEI